VLVEVELDAAPLARGAGVMVAANAPVAAVARIEEREGDAIAFLEGPLERVGLDALAQAVDDARELVTGHPPEIRPLVVAVIAPVVQIGAADGRGGGLDENAAGLD